MKTLRASVLWVGVLFAAPAPAQTTGLVPLSDLGAETYQGYPGGLYPDGANAPPPAHASAALQASAQVVPRAPDGHPDPNGLIAMIAVGMSNTTHEFAVFERNADADPSRNARVVLMDTALGGQTAAILADPAASYWTVMQQRLAAMGLSSSQVQVAWLKEADASPPNDFPLHAQLLRDELKQIARNLHDKFPNLRLCYVSSRTYGGYAAPGSLNPEPQAYESGFAVKWLIEEQIGGDPTLNYGQLAGAVRAPLLLWGPYLWADGVNPRSDGLTWLVTDFENDHTHPSFAGEQKVAGLLAGFFAGEPSAASWWPAQSDAVLVVRDARGDAYVQSANPSANFGHAAQLLAQGGAQPVRSYASFDHASAGRPAILAKLSLRVAQAGGGTLSRVDDSSWSEEAITWDNAPPAAAPLVALPQSSRDGTIAANVTETVNADPDGVSSFALSVGGAAATGYISREGGQPPRLVLVVPRACAGSPDADGDRHSDGCDCAPADPTLFAAPGEVRNLRWPERATLTWSSSATSSGTATRYDVMGGDLAAVGFLGNAPDDVCLADDLADTQLADPLPDPAPHAGQFYLVRGDNACGAGRWETATGGADRLTLACP